ncbi:hypothetical protein HYH02_001924 [Chlamydomonas schloesseri]|uniref:Maf-like protein n=1 Tax=Chlamydomonas schloesseri TaxID=2026947 RepID=A0A836BBM8_9CHLO|nr:hypothetical protein HYH02_001924 [Chlamydomonas schloesseri]|eukprot:KAG2453712.1 hypothetical protein HYH02_001924 [Chlamydomonas schloesseri]
MPSLGPSFGRKGVMTVDAQRVAGLRNKRIILGSQSFARKQIMTELGQEHGFSYEVRTADIDEKAIRDPSPEMLVRLLARAKREAIIAKMQAAGEPMQGLLITCDQVVVHEERILEKPGSVDEAHEYIDGYGRSPASTVGAVLATDLCSGRSAEDVETSYIHFRPIPEDVRSRLIEEGEVFYCAGGLMIEHPLVEPHIERMDGTQCSVMGLPKHLVLRLLLEAAGL